MFFTLIITGLFSLGAAKSDTLETIRTRSIELVDEQGQQRVFIGVDETGNGLMSIRSREDVVAVLAGANESGGVLAVNSITGSPAVFANVDDDNGGFLGISTKAGIPVVMATVGRFGNGTLNLNSAEGYPLIVVGTDSTGTSSVAFYDRIGQKNVTFGEYSSDDSEGARSHQGNLKKQTD
jgi:hypothetical protein